MIFAFVLLMSLDFLHVLAQICLQEPSELRVKCPLQSSKEELLELCKTYGVVTKCRMRKEDAVAMAVVQMATAQQAALAFRALGAPAKHVLQIDFASAEPHRSSCSQNVYVKGLPLGMPELQLRQVFSKYGKVLRLKALRMESKERVVGKC